MCMWRCTRVFEWTKEWVGVAADNTVENVVKVFNIISAANHKILLVWFHILSLFHIHTKRSNTCRTWLPKVCLVFLSVLHMLTLYIIQFQLYLINWLRWQVHLNISFMLDLSWISRVTSRTNDSYHYAREKEVNRYEYRNHRLLYAFIHYKPD